MSERILDGIGATPLSGVGRVVWYGGGLELGEPPPADDVDEAEERDRFESARDAARDELQAERERTAERVGEDEAEIFDAHIQFLDDPQITDAVEDRLEQGLPAEHAVQEGFEEPIETFENMDGIMAERADDLRDIRDRLLRLLTDGERVDLSALPQGSVVFAERLTPSDTAQLDPERVAGFATILGGRTSHAAIFARSLGIPAVVGVGDALDDVAEGTAVVVDGTTDEVVVDPSEQRRAAAEEEREVEVREAPVSTEQETEIEVAANLGTLAELDGAVAQGADGVGLFRTEFLFLDRESPPDEDEQVETYVDALDAFPEGRVVVRTLDVGGDKPIRYLEQADEDNPFLGNRGIRRSLNTDPELFESQLRALLRAAAEGEGDLAVMFPLVSTVDELEAALELVDSAAGSLDDEGVAHERPELGVMIETPAAVTMADELAARVEFLSIGTNDLTQYVMAASREDEAVSHLHDPLHPPVLRAIAQTVAAGQEGDAWVGMCGEMAGDPRLTELLVGLGLDELSMSAVTIPDVKANITEIDDDEAAAFADTVLESTTRTEVREHIQSEP